MASYADLTPYSYTNYGAPSDAQNVGWLGADLPFARGPVPPNVRDRLVVLAATPTNVMRGLHYCELCDSESPIEVSVAGTHDQIALLGTGEVHVAGNGVTFVAPTLIVHYIDAHDYRPPDAFIDAVAAHHTEP